MPPVTTPVYQLADRFVERYAALDPVAATLEGLTGHDAEMTDYSPDGHAERAEHDRAVLAELGHTPAENEDDRLAAAVLRDQLRWGLDLFDAGDHLRELNIIHSPIQAVRQVFDLMATDTEDDWEKIAARLALVPQALSSFESTLREGAREGLVAAVRQVVACARQADAWSGQTGDRPYFSMLVNRFDAERVYAPALVARLERVAERAGRGPTRPPWCSTFIAANLSPTVLAPTHRSLGRRVSLRPSPTRASLCAMGAAPRGWRALPDTRAQIPAWRALPPG